jgi:hypothetical protein
MEKINFVWTIVLGLAIGVGANVLTPSIRNLLGKIFTSIRHKNEMRREIFNKTVQYLVEHPYDEINLRNDKNTYFLMSMIVMMLALVLGALSNNWIVMTVSIAMALFGIVTFIKFHSRQKICLRAWQLRKKQHPDIDLDFS